jgi:hypothetical protein
MKNPADVLIGLDGQLLEIDFGLPSPLLGDGPSFALEPDDLVDQPSIVDMLANMARPRLTDPSAAVVDLTLIHRHFLDSLILDFWPYAHYYDSRDFMSCIRSICLSVSKLRRAGMSVTSSLDRPGVVIIKTGIAQGESFSVEGRSGGSVASLVLRAESLAEIQQNACVRLSVS